MTMEIVNCRPIYKSVKFIPEDAKNIILEKGTKLPPFVHKIAWRVVNWLGMVKSNWETKTITTFKPVSLGVADKVVAESVLSYLADDFSRSDLVAYIGAENWQEFMVTDSARGVFWAREQYGKHGFGMKIMDVPCIVLPNFKGVFVAPHPSRFGVELS